MEEIILIMMSKEYKVNKKSSKYKFIKMMWYLRKANKEFLENQVIREAITQEEMDETLNSPQIGE